MSQHGLPGSNNQQGMVVEKPKSDVYTVMLFIALAAVLAAIGLLSSELNKYEWDTNAQKVKSAPTSWVAPSAGDVA